MKSITHFWSKGNTITRDVTFLEENQNTHYLLIKASLRLHTSADTSQPPTRWQSLHSQNTLTSVWFLELVSHHWWLWMGLWDFYHCVVEGNRNVQVVQGQKSTVIYTLLQDKLLCPHSLAWITFYACWEIPWEIKFFRQLPLLLSVY